MRRVYRRQKANIKLVFILAIIITVLLAYLIYITSTLNQLSLQFGEAQTRIGFLEKRAIQADVDIDRLEKAFVHQYNEGKETSTVEFTDESKDTQPVDESNTKQDLPIKEAAIGAGATALLWKAINAIRFAVPAIP